MSISGSVPAHAYFGIPVSGNRLPAVDGARIAAASGPYIGRGNKCTANDDTCAGNRVGGELFCAGHLRSVRKAEKKAAESSVVSEDGV